MAKLHRDTAAAGEQGQVSAEAPLLAPASMFSFSCMAMESVMAVVPYLTPAIENLESLLKNEVALLWALPNGAIKKLSSTLSTIHPVLENAEQKQLKDKAMQNWLKELNDAAYEADDILDECVFEALRCECEGQGSSSASLKRKVLSYLPTTYASPNIPFHHNIGNRIKEITDKFDAIAANRSKFHLNERLVVEKRVEYDVSRKTSSFITQPQLYGRDEDRDKIV
ncbi:putative disease resistance protein RGA4 [Camellia sinensis]|uniref:putative disease resistance protein RGA4 n=1 Tax=Camellia sinensis TaxID=4442 RepID=UPI001035ABD8|nr:putative disease resistance protein RGA4 [Camellia sinensis]